MSLTHDAIEGLLKQYAVDPWVTGDVEGLDELTSDGFMLHPGLTLDSLKEAIHSTREALPDLHVSVEDVITDGEKVAYRWTMSGTPHEGAAGASRRTVTFTGITMLRLQNGRVLEDRYESSSPSLEEQLGLTENH
jgi:predicted ester cyclase